MAGKRTNERSRMGIRLARAISELALKDKDRIGGPNRDRGLAMGGGGIIIIIIIWEGLQLCMLSV